MQAAAFHEREIPTAPDHELLASLGDDALDQAVADYAFTCLDAVPRDREAELLRALPTGVRAHRLTWIVEGEVSNGGFHQNYWNNGTDLADEAVSAFEFIGAADHAALMREANALQRFGAAPNAARPDRLDLEA